MNFKDLSMLSPFIMDGNMYEVVMTPLHFSPNYIQLVFPFELPTSNSNWMRFEIIGKDTILQTIYSGVDAEMPIGPSHLFTANDFGRNIKIKVYRERKGSSSLIDTLILRTDIVLGNRVVFYIVSPSLYGA